MSIPYKVHVFQIFKKSNSLLFFRYLDVHFISFSKFAISVSDLYSNRVFYINYFTDSRNMVMGRLLIWINIFLFGILSQIAFVISTTYGSGMARFQLPPEVDCHKLNLY